MKKGWIKLFDVFAVFGVALIGCGLIYTSLFNKVLNTVLYDRIGNTPFYGAAIGLFLLLSLGLRGAVRGRGAERNTFINFHSEEGSVGIGIKAICDFIERIGQEFSSIKSIDSKLLKQKDSVDIALSVKVFSGNKIPELSHLLQQRVRESVRESLGLEEIGKITIRVQEIVGDPARSTPDKTSLGEDVAPVE